MTAKPKIVNVKSRYLTDEENEAIFKSLGSKSRTLATTVGELYCKADENRDTWDMQFSGVVYLVKDSLNRSYYIKFSDMKKKKLVWEQDMRKARNYAFSRSGRCSSLTINDRKIIFLKEDEIEKFKKEVENVMTVRTLRHRRANNSIDVGPAPSGSDDRAFQQHRHKSVKTMDKLIQKEIVNLKDFQRVKRVGWDPEKGFSLKELDPIMRDLFEKIGMDKDEKQIDKQTLDYIYDFIDDHGGVKALADDLDRGRGEPGTKNDTSQWVPLRPPPTYKDKLVQSPPSSKRHQEEMPPPLPSRKPIVSTLRPPSNKAKAYDPSQRTQKLVPTSSSINEGLPPPPPPPPHPPLSNQTQIKQPLASAQSLQILLPTRKKQTKTQTIAQFDGKNAGPKPSPQSSQMSQNTSGASAYQLITQSNRCYPTGITNFLHRIVARPDGEDFIKSNTFEPNTQTASSNEVDEDTGETENQVFDRCSNTAQASGTCDEVSGKRLSDSVSGATQRVSMDFEFRSDVFDGDHGEDA